MQELVRVDWTGTTGPSTAGGFRTAMMALGRRGEAGADGAGIMRSAANSGEG
jgi:hypothetical protein